MSVDEDDFRDELHAQKYPAGGSVTFSGLIHVLEMIVSNTTASGRDTVMVCDIEAAIRELKT